MDSEDGALRISMVIHKELDPDVYDLLISIKMPRVRSEYARRLLRDGAIKEIKNKGMHSHRKPDGAASIPPSERGKVKAKPKIIEEVKPGTASIQDSYSVRPGPVEDDSFMNDFVSGISGVPPR